MKFWKIGLGIVVLFGIGWIGWMATRPVPGTKIADQGREHVTPEAVSAFHYNSNPPTSGPHLPTWVKAGMFDSPKSEGELIHSLEHGYVVISYHCNESDGCKALVKNLTEFANRKKLWKLIVVPRPQLDTTIALTSWNYIDKFDGFDAKRIENFIDSHRDQGPEKTME